MSYSSMQSITLFHPNEILGFCPRMMQAEGNFLSHKPPKQVTSCIANQLYCRYPARALQQLSDRQKFLDNFQVANTAVMTPNFQSMSVSALCKGGLKCIASVMQGLLCISCKFGHFILQPFVNYNQVFPIFYAMAALTEV